MENDEWLDEPELPPRPRRRLLGSGGNPLALIMLAVLLIACGFIGGVLVEKGETSSGSSAGSSSSLASRFAALRGGSASTGARAGAGATGATGAFSGGFAGASGAGTRPTLGTVAYVAGSTLYVTNSEGNTVKVKTSAATAVTKTVSAAVKGIHPGETVTITGTSGSGGAISAESISVGSSGGGGLAALFGAARSSSSAAGEHSAGGEPSLFGGG